jgi:hypothetical protein
MTGGSPDGFSTCAVKHSTQKTVRLHKEIYMPYSRYPTPRELHQLAGYLHLVKKPADTRDTVLDRWAYLQRSSIIVFATSKSVGGHRLMAVQWAGQAQLFEVFMWNEWDELEHIAQEELPLS